MELKTEYVFINSNEDIGKKIGCRQILCGVFLFIFMHEGPRFWRR